MPAYNGKTHEELRWEDYQLGDKGDAKPFSSTTPTPTPLFGIEPSTFSTPAFASSTHTLNSSPLGPRTSNPSAPAQLQTPSGFCSYPGYYAQTPSVFNSTSFPPLGTPTSPSPFGTPSTSPSPGPTSSPFGQPPFGQPAGSPFFQAAPYNVQSAPAFSQSNAFARNMFSSTPSSPSTNIIMGWWNPINPFLSSPFQSAQAT